MKKLMLTTALLALSVPAHAAGAVHTCRGILAQNWTESVSDKDSSDTGSRLIRADDITASCLFDQKSPVGKQILATCRMGFACEVKATVDNTDSDVYNIIRVYSVRDLTKGK